MWWSTIIVVIVFIELFINLFIIVKRSDKNENSNNTSKDYDILSLLESLRKLFKNYSHLENRLRKLESNVYSKQLNEDNIKCPFCGSKANFIEHTWQNILKLKCDNPHCNAEISKTLNNDNSLEEEKSTLLKYWKKIN